MRTWVVWAVACALVLFVPALAGAEDTSSTLEKRIEELESKVQGLEEQESPGLFGEGATVGGDLKFYLFDQSRGSSNHDHQHNNISGGLSSAIIYINKEITDKLSVEVDPEILVHASATPRLGQSITRDTSADIELEFVRANVTYLLPHDFQVKAGLLKPLFTWDYGYEYFWHEEYHASFVSANPWLGSWHDFGLELYKPFEFERFSLPTYLYLLNGPGGSEVDNNEGKTVLLHVTPELFDSGLKFLGSFGYGKWDDGNDYEMMRYALGVNYTWRDLTLRGEYMGGTWKDQFIVFEGRRDDVHPRGYYVKALYKFTEKLQGLVNYNHLEHDFSGFFYTATDVNEEYDTITLGVDYSLADSVTVMFQVSTIDGSRDDHSADLGYEKITLGMRTTF